MTEFLAAVGAIVIGWPISAYMLMIIAGVIRAEWIPALPTIGYPAALLLTVLLAARAMVGGLVAALIKSATEDA
jgi:hypothetical protein